MVDFDEDKANKRIEDLHKKEEEDLAQMLSEKYGVEYLDLSRISIETDALRLIPEPDARAAKIAIFDAVGRKLKVAVLSPENDATKVALEDLGRRNYQTTLYMVSKNSLERAWARYREISFASETKAGVLDISSEEIEGFVSKVRSLADVQKLIEDVLSQNKSYRISRILEIVIAGALSMKASDVHVEPEEKYTRLRYRLDGVLTDIVHFDQETFQLLLSRIKLLSRLKLNLKNAAQDGRFSIKIAEEEIEIRTSLLPGAYSESVVLRILNPDAIAVSMEDLGIPENLFKILEREIKRPDGMILNTGPTGSGKTTTLYAFLKKVQTPEIKIITIEDPIEYHLEGITQSQVDHKEYTFASGLRSALRQDPDVIMVGEIRDEETAETAINSALTGHLVLSTLHTNSAAGTFPRLIDLGINPKVINSAINVAIAQRLLRKVCSACVVQETIPEKTKEAIKKELANAPNKPDNLQFEVMPKAVGCDKCSGLGYKGRIGIFEAILKSDELNKVIDSDPSETAIAKVAEIQGIMTMRQDGLVKVLSGTTTLEELSRVIDLGF
jgi:type II secretory ATPase GspE/PulE/Tfp pilus assembly ATPase PilB-like protein